MEIKIVRKSELNEFNLTMKGLTRGHLLALSNALQRHAIEGNSALAEELGFILLESSKNLVGKLIWEESF